MQWRRCGTACQSREGAGQTVASNGRRAAPPAAGIVEPTSGEAVALRAWGRTLCDDGKQRGCLGLCWLSEQGYPRARFAMWRQADGHRRARPSCTFNPSPELRIDPSPIGERIT